MNARNCKQSLTCLFTTEWNGGVDELALVPAEPFTPKSVCFAVV